MGDRIELETFTWDGLISVWDGQKVGLDAPRIPLEVVGVGDAPKAISGADRVNAPSFVVAGTFFDAWRDDGILRRARASESSGFGELGFTVVEGRGVERDGEALLGGRTMDARSAWRSATRLRRRGRRERRVAAGGGHALLPTIDNEDPASGTGLTLSTYESSRRPFVVVPVTALRVE